MRKIFALLTSLVIVASFTGCDDDDNGENYGGIGFATTDGSDTLFVESSAKSGVFYMASATEWTAAIEEEAAQAYASITPTSGDATDQTRIRVKFDSDNAGNPDRVFHVVVRNTKGQRSMTVVHKGSSMRILTEADVPDLDKFYKPQEFSNMNMFREDAKWSWVRSKQTEHFVIFWEAGYGDNPNASPVPSSSRVDVDDLLQKAEQFYTTNVETLKMCTVGQGKSYLDKYKMQIYLLYQSDWCCAGSGYDNVIGALWVNWSPCQPSGSSVAHEVGHSFQYQTYCDKICTGELKVSNQASPTSDELHRGYRYGFGPNGDGGCAYWEQCAQWQSFQDYPDQAYDQSWSLFTGNCHRHFNHEWMRYQSYWFQYYMVQQHGVESFGRLWQESYYPEDPLETYTRLYCNGDLEAFWDFYYQYAAHAVTYDFDAVKSYIPSGASSHYSTTMLSVDGKFRPSYSKCPSTSGFNVISLNNPEKGTTAKVTLSALAVGSALAAADAGVEIDVDGKTVGTHTTYNDNVYDGRKRQATGFRFGFVGVKDGKAVYGPMAKGSTGTATMDVTDDFDEFYLVVVGAPTEYNRQYWNDDESDDIQWPYEVSFEGTGILGNVDIPEGDPEDVSIDLTVSCDASTNAYELGSINLLKNGVMEKMAKAFKIQPSEIAAATQTPAVNQTATPSEGKVVIGLANASGTISYTYTANVGFWCNSTGSPVSWGNSQAVFVEFTPASYLITYGHMHGTTTAGAAYKVRPVYVYTKDGVQYKATINLTMQF